MTVVTWNVQGSAGLDVAGVADVVARRRSRRPRRSRRSAGGSRGGSPAASGCSGAGRSSTRLARTRRAWPCSRRTASSPPRRFVLRRERWWDWRRRIAIRAEIDRAGERFNVDQRPPLAARRRRQPSSGGGDRRRRRPPAAAPAGHRRRLQRPPGRSRPGRSRAPPGGSTPGRSTASRRRRFDELDRRVSDAAGRPPSGSTTCSPRPAGRWSTPPCWRRRSASTGSPSAPITCRSRRARATGAATMSEVLLDKIRKLLAKAEGTDNANEAEAFSAKAAQLIAEHRIDPEHVRDALAHGALGLRRIALGRGAYVRARLALLDAVARNHDCEVVFETGPGARRRSRRIRVRPRRHRGAVHVVARPGGEPDGRRSVAHAGGDAALAAVVPVRLRQPRRRAARRGPRPGGRGDGTDAGDASPRSEDRAPRRARPIGTGARVRGAARSGVSCTARAGRPGAAVGLARRPPRRGQRRPRAVTCRRSAGVEPGRSVTLIDRGQGRGVGRRGDGVRRHRRSTRRSIAPTVERRIADGHRRVRGGVRAGRRSPSSTPRAGTRSSSARRPRRRTSRSG